MNTLGNRVRVEGCWGRMGAGRGGDVGGRGKGVVVSGTGPQLLQGRALPCYTVLDLASRPAHPCPCRALASLPKAICRRSCMAPAAVCTVLPIMCCRQACRAPAQSRQQEARHPWTNTNHTSHLPVQPGLPVPGISSSCAPLRPCLNPNPAPCPDGTTRSSASSPPPSMYRRLSSIITLQPQYPASPSTTRSPAAGTESCPCGYVRSGRQTAAAAAEHAAPLSCPAGRQGVAGVRQGGRGGWRPGSVLQISPLLASVWTAVGCRRRVMATAVWHESLHAYGWQLKVGANAALDCVLAPYHRRISQSFWTVGEMSGTVPHSAYGSAPGHCPPENAKPWTRITGRPEVHCGWSGPCLGRLRRLTARSALFAPGHECNDTAGGKPLPPGIGSCRPGNGPHPRQPPPAPCLPPPPAHSGRWHMRYPPRTGSQTRPLAAGPMSVHFRKSAGTPPPASACAVCSQL